mmetsp:Transcript_13201/g.25991  ORF Transcript_13201/g.25991 Transcript_13201/m.25991 type:complete len:125 (+) Transcript_13201:34-408(+)
MDAYAHKPPNRQTTGLVPCRSVGGLASLAVFDRTIRGTVGRKSETNKGRRNERAFGLSFFPVSVWEKRTHLNALSSSQLSFCTKREEEERTLLQLLLFFFAAANGRSVNRHRQSPCSQCRSTPG